MIDQVNIKNAFMKKSFINASAENIYFSDHDTVTIVIEKHSQLVLILKSKMWKPVMKCKTKN